jgi:hypothetical protein
MKYPEQTKAIFQAVIDKKPLTTARLLAALPQDAEIQCHWEGYSWWWRRTDYRAFKVLISDKRFLFDSLFIDRCLYFTHRELRDVVLGLPRAREWIEDPDKFMRDYKATSTYEGIDNFKGLGMSQRFVHAGRNVEFWKRRTGWRLMFLYAALIRWSRRFIERYYAPGGAGMRLAQKRFEERTVGPTVEYLI